MNNILIYILQAAGLDLQRLAHYWHRFKGISEVIEDVNHENHDKRCLMIYITVPFQTEGISKAHQNFLQAREMARIIGRKGYVVDVVHYQKKYVKLRHNYDFVVGLIPRGIDIYTKHMNPGCIQVAYLTSMNLAVTSGNEEKRIEECYQRRGVRLKPRRFAGYIEKRIEEFDAVWYIGNEYNFQSYTDSFKMPPSFRIKNTGYIFDWADPDADRDPHCFMYFGSAGQVHKGLDLLLELFAEEIKNCTLFVCGGYAGEEDFDQEYHKELYETSNIIPVGFVDVDSLKYKELSKKCAYSILPSCAEGCAGSVLANMSAGIIPIVSKECGFEDDEVINLNDCKKDTIKLFIKEYCNKDSEWVKERSRHSIEIVRERYSDKSFTESIENALTKTIEGKNK